MTHTLIHILSLICLSCFILCIPAVWSSDDDTIRSSAVHHLHLVYGSERIQAHFLSHDELHEAVQTIQQDQQSWLDSSDASQISHRSLSTSEEKDISGADMEEDMKRRTKTVLPQLTCVMYSAGSQAKTALLQIFGAEHVSTLHASQSDNRACFLVTTTLQHLEDAIGGGSTTTTTRATGEAGGDSGGSGYETSAAFNNFRNIDFV